MCPPAPPQSAERTALCIVLCAPLLYCSRALSVSSGCSASVCAQPAQIDAVTTAAARRAGEGPLAVAVVVVEGAPIDRESGAHGLVDVWPR